MRNRNSGGYIQRHLNGDQLQIVHTIQYPCICLGSMWQSAATWHFPWHHSFPARFKLCAETWKQYIPMRNRAILLYLILNGLLFQLNVLTGVRGKSVLWFWSFLCESRCHLSHCKAVWWGYSRWPQLDGTWLIVRRFAEGAIQHLVIWNDPVQGQCWHVPKQHKSDQCDGFIDWLKAILEISLSLLIGEFSGSPDSPASASKFQSFQPGDPIHIFQVIFFSFNHSIYDSGGYNYYIYIKYVPYSARMHGKEQEAVV